MNKLLITAAASAILMPLGVNAAQSDAEETKMKTETVEQENVDRKTDAKITSKMKTDADRMKAETVTKTTYGAETADMETSAQTTSAQTTSAQKTSAQKDKSYADADMDENADMKVGARSMSVKELLGEGIHGVDGDRIARIDDLVIGANGQIQDVVFLSGGVFGLGGKRGALDYNTIDIAMEEDREPVVNISLTEEAIQSAVEYETEEMNDYSLASELIGAEVDLTRTSEDNEDDVVVNDIIIADSGVIEHLIVQNNIIGGIGAGEKHAVAYSKLSVAQGDGGLVLDMTQAELDAAPTFTSLRADIGSRANRAWTDTKDGAKKAWDKTKDGAEDVKDDIDQ
ncbi:hypothetical protein [Hyphococcus sp.]|uniref:hypothetical protein n=1 Tax=Hyphococcus sp. TaxID=2038636 RepID=UPI003CCC1E29